MAVAVPPEPDRIHDLSGERAHRGGSDQEPVGVEVLVAAVVEDVQVEHQGVARREEVLNEEVDDAEVLRARVEQPVQSAVRVLLQGTEVDGVVLIPIRPEVAEQAEAQLVVAEDEAAEVAGEALDTGPGRDEVVVGTDITQVILDEQLLEALEGVVARGALAHVDVHDARLPGVEVVQVEHGRHADFKVPRLEGRVALEETERQDEVLVDEDLIAGAEELRFSGLGRAGVARQRDPPQLQQAVADGRHAQEVALSEDRIIALEDVLVVRIPPAPSHVRRLQRPLVAVPVGESQAPAVEDRHEVGAGLDRNRPTGARTGEAGWLVLGLRRSRWWRRRGRRLRWGRRLFRRIGLGTPRALGQEHGRWRRPRGRGHRRLAGDGGKRGQGHDNQRDHSSVPCPVRRCGAQPGAVRPQSYPEFADR